MDPIKLLNSYTFAEKFKDSTFLDSHTYYSTDQNIGWTNKSSRKNVTRKEFASESLRSFVLGSSPSTLRFDMPSGQYRIQIHSGDGKGVLRHTRINLQTEKQSILVGKLTTQREHFGFLSCDFEIPVNSQFFTLTFDDGDSDNQWVVNKIELFSRTEPAQAIQSKTYLPEMNNWKLPSTIEITANHTLKEWEKTFDKNALLQPTKVDRHTYLDLIEGNVDFFKNLQDSNGAIIDPQKKEEFQYSTPCFAYCAALISVERERLDLIQPALMAFKFSAKALANRTAANGHEDFYPAPLAYAYKHLLMLVDEKDLSEAASLLKSFDPYTTYRKRPGGTKKSGANWNCKSLAGQYLLEKEGLQEPTEYSGDSLLRQGKLFNNRFGLYAEGPMTYDSFPRAWLACMLHAGYDGPGATDLDKALSNANITSLFMQGPNGELPIGGRSSHHLWADAVQCVNFEWGASKIRDENSVLAGKYKRAARKALSGMLSWQRESGELFVVKNRFEPEERHGFELYSAHSQYNLLCMTALGFAFELAKSTDNIEESYLPSEIGSSGLFIDSGIDKAFANSNGYQVELATELTPNQTPRGIVRILKQGIPCQIPLGDGLPRAPLFNLNSELSDMSGYSLGMSWITSEEDATGISPISSQPIASLSSLSSNSVKTNILSSQKTADGWFLQVSYEVICNLKQVEVIESIEVTGNGVAISWNWSAEANLPMLLHFPIFCHDGKNESKITQQDNKISIEYKNSTSEFSISQTDNTVKISENRIPFRLGYFKLAEVTPTKSSISLFISAN